MTSEILEPFTPPAVQFHPQLMIDRILGRQLITETTQTGRSVSS